MIDVHCAVSE